MRTPAEYQIQQGNWLYTYSGPRGQRKAWDHKLALPFNRRHSARHGERVAPASPLYVRILAWHERQRGEVCIYDRTHGAYSRSKGMLTDDERKIRNRKFKMRNAA